VNVNDFEIGTTYRMRAADWEAPTGQIAPGKEMVRRILVPADQTNSSLESEPAPAHVIQEWQKFLRVEDINSGNVHFLHPETIDSAEAIQ